MGGRNYDILQLFISLYPVELAQEGFPLVKLLDLGIFSFSLRGLTDPELRGIFMRWGKGMLHTLHYRKEWVKLFKIIILKNWELFDKEMRTFADQDKNYVRRKDRFIVINDILYKRHVKIYKQSWVEQGNKNLEEIEKQKRAEEDQKNIEESKTKKDDR